MLAMLCCDQCQLGEGGSRRCTPPLVCCHCSEASPDTVVAMVSFSSRALPDLKGRGLESSGSFFIYKLHSKKHLARQGPGSEVDRTGRKKHPMDPLLSSGSFPNQTTGTGPAGAATVRSRFLTERISKGPQGPTWLREKRDRGVVASRGLQKANYEYKGR